MQRGGKRKSPFVGGSQPAVDGILYSRYNDMSAVLLDGEVAPSPAAAPASGKKERKEKRRREEGKAAEQQPEAAAQPAPAAANGTAEPAAEGQKQRKKPRWSEEQKAAAKAEREAATAAKKAARKAAAGGADATTPAADQPAAQPAEGDTAIGAAADDEVAAEGKKKSKKEKKAKGPVKLAPEERVSGPGNAEEAQRMRQALGFTAPAAPVQQPAAGSTFAFGFGSGGAAAAKAQADSSIGDDSSTQDEDSGSSSSDEEEQQEARTPAAAKAASSDSEESSDEDDSSSSDDEDESSSDEEEAQPAAAKPAPKQADSSDSSSSSEDEDSDDEEEGSKVAAGSDRSSSSSSSSDSEDEAPQRQNGDAEFVPRRVYIGGMPYGYTEDQLWEYWGYCGEIESLDMMTFPDTGRFRGIVFITFKTEEGYEKALACNGEQCDGQTLKVVKCRPSPKERAAMQAARQVQQGQQPAQPAQQAQQPAPQRQQYAPPPRYEAQEQAAEQPVRQQWQQRERAPLADGGAAEGGDGGQRRQHSGPAPKTPGYHVAYVGNVAYEADDKAIARLFEPCGVIKVRLHTDKDTGRPKGFAHVHFRDEAGLDHAMSLDGTALLGRRIRVGYAQPKKEQPAAA